MTTQSGAIEMRPSSREGTGEPVLSTRRVLVGLLRQEWLAHGRMILMGLSAWLIGLWILEMLDSPGWIMAFGLIYGMIAATRIGGSDSIHGTEEFTLSLPPTRSQRYLVRLALALVPLLFFVSAGLYSILWDLPPRLWGLAVETGLTRPYDSVQWHHLKDFSGAIIFPVAVLAVNFAVVAVCGRSAAFVAWLGSLMVCALVAGTGGWLGDRLLAWGLISRSSVSLLIECLVLVLAVASQVAGYAIYVRREGVPRQGRGWDYGFWLIVAGVILSLILMVILGNIRC